MDTSSSSRFYIAKAEESALTIADAELETLTTVGSEGASASRRSEYYSARCEEMMRSRGQFPDAVAMEIEFSKPHWSEVSRVEVAPQSAEEEELNRENREVFEQLWTEHPLFFWHDLASRYRRGRMIAKGGQAEIYEVEGSSVYLMKVFKRGTSLRALRGSCPLPVLNHAVRQCIVWAGLLEDGRFAFVMVRFWGDLRKLIDQAMQEKNGHGIQGPPFPYRWDGWNLHPTDFMFEVAKQMRDLHEKGVSHRDLKASNILLQDFNPLDELLMLPGFDFRWTTIADFECSIGVLGTGFWRAPEILEAVGNASTISNEQWKKADVYSYGMTCFEIVTGRIPFEGELENTKAHRQLVINGKRPQLPSDLDNAVKDLITKCWAQNPCLRPTFSQIVEMVETISKKQCEFRLFDIVDELPPQYHLATIQEVDEYSMALIKAMPHWIDANLANGSVGRREYFYDTRLKK